MQFARKTLKCMGCKAALPPGQSTLCKHCKGKEAELYIKSLLSVRQPPTAPVVLVCVVL
jgi:DNA polymerase delta subunit 1